MIRVPPDNPSIELSSQVISVSDMCWIFFGREILDIIAEMVYIIEGELITFCPARFLDAEQYHHDHDKNKKRRPKLPVGNNMGK